MFERIRGSFSQTPRALALVARSAPRGAAALGLLTIGSALLPLAIAVTGKAIMDAVVARSAALTLRWALVELGLVALQALGQRALSLTNGLIGARLGLDINVMILEKALTLSLRHFEDPEFYDQLTRARREASFRPLSMVTATFSLFQNAVTLAGYIVVLTRFSGLAVLGLVIAAIPATVAEMRFSNAAFRMRNWRSPETRRLNYLEYVLANDGHAKEVKLFGLGPVLLERYRALGESFYKEDKQLAVRRAGWAYGLSLIGTLAFYACYVVMAIAAAEGRLTLGNMVLYVMAFRQGQQSFQAILGAIGGMYEDNLYMSNLFAYLAIPVEPSHGGGTRPRRPAGQSPSGPHHPAIHPGFPERSAASGLSSVASGDVENAGGVTGRLAALSVPAEPDVFQGLRFENVGFRYPGREAWALRHVNLTIPKGQSLALVGHNGAGKTTFIKLLTRLYEPTEGRILLDGRDLRAWDPEALRRRVGVIFQDFNQYQLKARENVGFGSVDHRDDDARVGRAVDRGGAAAVVEGLKAGLDTQLGRWFKEGAELSGGQWQKIALARAFMREEADILVLDEPTAALDAEAEHAVFERFRALAEGRTTILISHRFPTVRMADRIVVIDGGRIVEEGTHDALVAEGGRYAHLFSLQARGYA